MTTQNQGFSLSEFDPNQIDTNIQSSVVKLND